MDDTLVDSFNARSRALQIAFNSKGLKELSAVKFFLEWRGVELREALTKCRDTCHAPDEIFEHYRQIYWTKPEGWISLLPGVKNMLENLKKSGILLGLVTQKMRSFEINGKPAGVVVELAELEILDMFAVVIGFEDVIRPKPHPEGINLALKQLNVEPHVTLVAGDSSADIEAAQAAGCHSCLVTWGITSYSSPDGLQADMVARAPEDILKLPR